MFSSTFSAATYCLDIMMFSSLSRVASSRLPSTGERKRILLRFTIIDFEQRKKSCLLYTSRLDSNILLACVPLVYYLFSCLLYTNIHVPQLSEIPFRAISKYYYLVHPLMILFVHAWFPQVDSFWMAVAKVVCVLCCTHICTLLLIHMKKRYPAVPL